MSANQPSAAATKTAATPGPARTPLLALIVEDNPSDAELTVAELRRGGFDPTWSRVDSEAAFVAALSPELDVVLADYTLPQFSGPRALAILRERGLDVPCIVVTGTVGEETAVECLKQGAADYLLKDRLGRLGSAVTRARAERLTRRAMREGVASLQASEARFRAIVEQNIAGVSIFSTDGTIEYVNTTFARLCGYRPDEVIGRLLTDFVFEPERDAVMALFAEALAGTRHEATLALKRKDGQRLDVLANGAVVTFDGRPAVITVVMDITDRNRTVRELEFTNTVLATEQRASPDGILVVDGQRRVISCNDRFVEIFQMPPALTQAGSDAAMLAHAAGLLADPKAFVARVDYLYQHPDEKSHEEVVLKDGRVLDRYSSPMILPDGTSMGRVWFFRDVTELRTSERTLRQLNRTLRTLSAGDSALVRAGDEQGLLGAMVRTVVEVGGYAAAWVGYPEHDERQSVRIVACYGLDRSVCDRLQVSWSEASPLGLGPTGVALRTGVTQVNDDILQAPHMAPWRAIFEEIGCRSSLSLPLKDGARTLGALNIYACEPHAFDADERLLLEELAGDLGYGIVSLRTEVEKRTAMERLRRALESTVEAMAATVERRDPFTAGHQRRVALLSEAIGHELGLSQTVIDGLHFGALIHDLGKVQVPAELLAKPSALTQLEFELIKTHVEAGFEIVKHIAFPWPVGPIILQHHERLDGSGYPKGLKREAICLEARILAVADVVEAMSSHRPYRPSLGIDAALEEIEAGRATRYEAAAVDACVTLFREKGFTFA